MVEGPFDLELVQGPSDLELVQGQQAWSSLVVEQQQEQGWSLAELQDEREREHGSEGHMPGQQRPFGTVAEPQLQFHPQ